MGYKFQFVTLAGFHALNYSMFMLAHGYRDRGMAAYSELQQAEFEAENTVTQQHAINAKSEQATLMKYRLSLQAVKHQLSL